MISNRAKTAVIIGLLAFGAPAAAFAQSGDFLFEPQRIEACLAGKKGIERLSCAGEAANHCMEANEGGGSTVGMGACLDKEHAWWDARLNDAYGEISDRERADDEEADAGGWSAPRKLPALKEMQRAWIKYRDTLCEHEAVQWGGGTGAGPAYLSCLMSETARQYFVLADRLEYFGDR